MQYATTDGAQGICPAGSHIPTDVEVSTLETYLGTSTAGTQLKSGGSSGLNILLSGYRRFLDSSFYYLSTYGYLWTSTESGTTAAWNRTLDPGSASLIIGAPSKSSGHSVRCLVN